MWSAGPGEPLLADGAVHVWRADLDTVSGEQPLLLSADEHARAARIFDERRRLRWMRSRALLRALLGGYTSVEPRSLRLTAGEHRKPALQAVHGSDAAELCFNLSHSGKIALYAFSWSGPVGVDVEVARRHRRRTPALVARAFGPEQAGRLAALPPSEREREFLRLWVRHEATLKLGGGGLGDGCGQRGAAGAWIAELALGPAAAGALAAERPPSELRCWEWRPPQRASA
jgi:4'-phosphopantetheinyl transferase